MKNIFKLFTIIALFYPGFVVSQEQVPEITATDLNGRADFSIPSSPAFTILGVTPDSVVHPSSYRSLAVSFLEGLDPTGNVQTGFAVDTKPYFLARGKNITLSDYRENPIVRQLSRMQLSFATSSTDSNSLDADRYGLSLRWTPWDVADPRLDTTLDDCRRQSLNIDDSATSIDQEIATSEVERKRLKELDIKCRQESKKQHWNANSWDIGIAGFSTAVDSGGSESGHALWSSLALQIKDRGQAIIHIRHADNELVPVGDETGLVFNPVSRTTIGGRLKYGNSRGALLLEAVHVKEEDSEIDLEGNRYLFGAEFRVRDGMWIQLAVGDSDGDLVDDSDVYYSGQFRWAFAENSLFK